jgi:bifunctional UDP-N-acetylglucosamine pyrophosphorylase/glucosamine-1-phosphate N-acetyltransferase
LSTNLGVIVLAAGQGTRMKSALPKVLHPVCGKPMAAHVLAAARALGPTRIAVVVGYGRHLVEDALRAPDVTFVEQTELLGTADAVRRCREAMAGCDPVMVLNGDSPLVTGDLLARLSAARGTAPMALTTCPVPDDGSFGRIVRDAKGAVEGIVEGSRANEGGTAERNAGQYVFDAAWLWAHINAIAVSDKGEYYLTHLPAMAHAEGRPAVTCEAPNDEVMGFDDRVGLAEAERLMRQRILRAHMLAGVTIADPATTYIDADTRLAGDVTVLPNCYLYGATTVATGSVIGPGTTLRSARIGEATHVQASVIEDSSIGARVEVGPFAHVRGGATIGDECVLGNYAEVKNSVLGRGVKMHHFSYIGDADVGEYANIAAGIITCNYDGVSKHRTTIGARAFVGSDTMLVAPVTIGEGASTGAGSVVTKDVPPGGRVAGVPARAIPRRPKREA